MITIAFAGCAHIHTPGFVNAVNARESFRVKYVWDPHVARGEFNAKALKATFTSDLATIAADADVSGVVVCSETDRHQTIVEPLVTHGKHLFVEKPLGMAAQDAYEMAELIEQSGVRFQTGFWMRSVPNVRTLKKLVDDGFFGKITRARVSNCHGGALGGWFDAKPTDPAHDWRWMANLKHSGVGAFGDLGAHALDVLIHLLGPVESVTGTLDLVTRRYEGCDETGEALMRFENGAIVTMAAGWVDVDNPVSFQISGTKGIATVIDGKLHLKRGDSQLSSVLGDVVPSAPGPFDLWLDALEGKRNDVAMVGAREAAYRNGVMEAIYAAAKTQTWQPPRHG